MSHWSKANSGKSKTKINTHGTWALYLQFPFGKLLLHLKESHLKIYYILFKNPAFSSILYD